jgi:hypothetical protein
MRKRKLNDEDIVEKIKDKSEQDFILIPNKSLGIFILGDKIDKYLYLPHKFKHEEYKYFSSNSYDFYNGKISVWTIEDSDSDINKIDSIRCDTECHWRNHNLIGMIFTNFLKISETIPNNKGTEYYVPINRDRGQNQTVYEFDKLGLMIWVWRKKIRTIIVSKYEVSSPMQKNA